MFCYIGYVDNLASRLEQLYSQSVRRRTLLELSIARSCGLLQPLADDSLVTRQMVSGVTKGVIEGYNENFGFRLCSTLGTRVYHRVNHNLAAALDPNGFQAGERTGQGRFISTGNRYPEPYRLIPVRGWKRPGHIRVNRKGRRTIDLLEQNSRLIDHQLPLEGIPPGRRIDEDLARNVWVVYEFTPEVLSIYLVFGSQLRENGRILNWAELLTLAKEIRLVPEPRPDLPQGVDYDFGPLEEK